MKHEYYNEYTKNPYNENAGTKVTVGCGCFLFLIALKIAFFLAVIWVVVMFLRYLGVNI